MFCQCKRGRGNGRGRGWEVRARKTDGEGERRTDREKQRGGSIGVREGIERRVKGGVEGSEGEAGDLGAG